MFNPHRKALDRLFSQFDDSEGETLRKLAPKAEMSVEVTKPEGDEGLPPELVAKLIAVLKDAASEEMPKDEPAEALELAKGGMVEGGLKDRFTCQGCGKDIASCRCDKMAEGGLIDGETLHDEQMRRRDAQREADKDADASNDMAELASGKEVAPQRWKVREPRKSRYWKE